MSTFRGVYFDGLSSKPHPVTVTVNAALEAAEGPYLQLSGALGSIVVPLKQVRFEPALGKTRRVLHLSRGARLETPAADIVAELERRSGQNRGLRGVSWLEAQWQRVLVCLVGLAILVWVVASYGIPLGARLAASLTPPGVLAGVSERSLELLDRQVFEPTQLSEAQRRDLQIAFQRLTAELGASPNRSQYRLVFRAGAQVGPNAFALPSGLIIVTDELVALAQDDRELLSVLAHEVGHVERRHGLRSLYQSAGVFVLVAVVAGDVVSMSSVAASLPTLLLETGYSRRFEREADEVAAHYALEQGWGTAPLERLLTRLSETPGAALPDFLSTHPATLERVRYLRELERSQETR